jgi:glycerol uptake facilitator-like aquaporin
MSSDSVAVNENDTTPIINRPRDNFIQPPPLHARLLCELLGTCFFVFFGAGCATKGPGLLAASTAHGLATIWLVYVFGPVSGGHFNAGPTIAFAIDGNMKVLEILGYLLAQAIGGLLAGALLLALYGTGTTLGTPMLSPGVNVAQGFAIEFICTTVLSFVIKFTTTYHTHKEAAFPIGLVVFSSFLVGADRDGAALNPWRWLGPAVASNTFRSEAWIYFVGPICGFICGYGLFRLYKLFWNASIYRPI